MLGAALISLVLLADATDVEFLRKRVKGLAARYEDHARRQGAASVHARLGVIRELRHLPLAGAARTEAGRLLAQAVGSDRSYRVRAEAARAIGRVGTAPALDAMYRALFGNAGRSRRFLLLYTVLPDALAGLRHADAMEWISLQVLRPAAAGEDSRRLREAGGLRWAMVALTLEGVGAARARVLAPDVVALAGATVPEVRAAAVGALVALNHADPVLFKALEDPSDRVRAAAAAFPGLPLQHAADAAEDRSVRVRRAAIAGLARRNVLEAVSPLIRRLLAEPNGVLRMEIADALNRLTGKEFGTDHGLWRTWWGANRARFEPGGEKKDDSARTYFFELGLRTKRAIFLIDVSASMSREDERNDSRLAYAARELTRAIGKLRNDVRYEVFAFAGTVRRFKDDRQEGRWGAADAGRWLGGLQPAGPTNTYGALMTALHDPLQPDAIVLLSDGNPSRCSWRGKNFTEHEQILAEVRRVNADKEVRIHTVALLNGVPRVGEEEDTASAADFLRRLAAQNRGEFREIR